MISDSLAKLTKLELDETVLFHGSGLRIIELEPRQAHTIINERKVNDGPPAIYATQFIDYAIFMALINQHNCALYARSYCSFENNELIFGATQGTLDQLSDKAVGYVHVLRRADFTLRGGSEWFATTLQKPIEIIEISRDDFTRSIQIMENLMPVVD